MPMDGYVVGIGEVLWDMLPSGKQLGGAPANFAYHITQFGLPGLVVSAVGNDHLGDEIIETFDSKGLKYLIEKVPSPTGTVQIELDDAGVPQYEIRENAAWDNIPLTPALRELAHHTKAVCFGSLAQRSAEGRRTIAAFIDEMPHQSDTLIIFDANLRQNFYDKEILEESMQRCNILKINDEELNVISRLFDFPDTDIMLQCRWLLDRYSLKALILTCGMNGSYIFTPDTTSFIPTPEVEVADTIGAGDSFTAAFIASILKGDSITEAHARAVATSAFVCTKKGAMPPLPEDTL